MIRHLYAFCAIGLLALVSVYGFTSRGSRADLTYVNPSGIHTLDPARMSWNQDFRVALNIWEGLTTSHPRTTAPMGGAAKFPPTVSDNGLTYTFSIREDATWSNGDAVTAGDFVRGWRRAIEPGSAADYAFLFRDHIVGADAYVRWRLDAVAELTALSRLRDGWGVNAEQVRDWATRPSFARVRRAIEASREPPLPEPNPTDGRGWARLAQRLSGMRIDWSALYEEAFRAHVAALDDRFAQVGVRAVDTGTLEVRLLRPCPYFLDLAAFPTLLPCHKSIEILRERHRDTPITEQGLVVYDPQWTKPRYHRNGYPGLVTNGPYRLADWRFKRRARLAVNPYYRKAGDIDCRTVDMLVFDNISAAIMAYEAGDVDFLPAMDVPYDHEIARLARSGERPDFRLCHVLATYFLNFNCVSAQVAGHDNPFVDARVRKAFGLAVDKRAIVDNVLKRGDQVAGSFVPDGAIEGYDAPSGLAYDPDEARRLLATAGYPEGAGLPPIELLYVPSDERVCQALARMWERDLNARFSLRCKESKTFAEDKANHRFMIARGNWYADYYDPTTFLDCLATGNGNNDSGYSSESYDRLLADAGATADAAARFRLLRQAERIIVEEDLPILPLLHYAQPIAIKPYVQGLYPNPRLRFSFRHVSVDR